MASRRIEERRAYHKRYKEDVERSGKSFFPHAMYHDTVMSLIVVGTIVTLACVWYFTASGSDDPGLLGPYYTEKADPGTTNFVPRPDWYFYFLFYLLRIFKWPESVLLGTIGIPTIALILLIALPFFDLRSERRISRRPVAIIAGVLVILSMGVLTFKGATAKEALGSELLGHVSGWAKKEGYTGNQAAVKGAKLFAVSGCLNCHMYNGDGGQNLGAPELTAEGAKNKGIAFQIAHLKCPACVNAGSPMPSFAGLGDDRLKLLATFLESSKGSK